jgi:hypothetical protein
MITVSIYNKCEIEMNSTTGFIEDLKLFKIKYSKNLFNLTFKTPSEITKKYVDSLVEPDFECVSADFNDSCDKLVLNFEKVKTKASVAQPVCSQTVESVQTVVEENKEESPENQSIIKEETQSVELPKPKKPRARRRTKAEMEAARAENAKKLAGIS